MVLRWSSLIVHAVLPGCLLCAGCAALQPTGTDPGVRVERMSLSLAGTMLDMRYRITDRGKAAAMFSEKRELSAMHLKSGLALQVPAMPKVGKLRQMPADDGRDRIYWMFFSNAQGVVTKGDRIAVRLGEVLIETVVVE